MSSLVKGKEVSLGASNWRKVPECEKDKLWITLKAYFDLTEANKYWVMKSAAKKWRAFKHFLKRKFYDAELTLQQNIANGCNKRIPNKQWEKLCKYWRNEKTMAISMMNKLTRANQPNCRHTAGTRSFACVHEQEELKEGIPISRAKLYRIVHTNKDGFPVDGYCATKIDQITIEFNANPLLITEEHKEGDLHSRIFPNPSNNRMHGFGIVVGGKSTQLLDEATAALRESRGENLELRGLVQTLLANQGRLEEKLNSYIASQEFKTSSKIEQHEEEEGIQKVATEARGNNPNGKRGREIQTCPIPSGAQLEVNESKKIRKAQGKKQ